MRPLVKHRSCFARVNILLEVLQTINSSQRIENSNARFANSNVPTLIYIIREHAHLRILIKLVMKYLFASVCLSKRHCNATYMRHVTLPFFIFFFFINKKWFFPYRKTFESPCTLNDLLITIFNRDIFTSEI